MKFRTILLIGAVIIFAACVIAIGIGVFFLTRVPSVESRVYPGSTPIHVMLSAPSSQAGFPLNSYIPVQAEAYGGGTISTIELYINGVLYQKVSTPAGWSQSEYATGWNWQPGTTGVFILLAKATNTQGGTGVSDPIRVDVTEAARMVSPYLPTEGETLESIAGSEQISLPDLTEANPDILDPAQTLPVDAPINLPIPPETITNPNIISGFPVVEIGILPEVDTNTLPPPGDDQDTVTLVPPGEQQPGDVEQIITPESPEEPTQDIFHLPSLQDLRFWFDENKPAGGATLPLEPRIKASFSSCDVKVWLNNGEDFDVSYDPSQDDPDKVENGFFLYRSQDGKPLQRIATLPPIDKNAIDWQYQQGYPLANQFGVVTYVLSAFNAAGETMSTPVSLPLDQYQCTSLGRGLGSAKVRIEDGNLVLPHSMDLAYLYLSINNARSVRVPEGDRMFLPDSGMKLNLYDYFNTLLGSFNATDFDISMEVWGWTGSTLKFVGNYQTTIHRSVLLVCSEEGKGKCSGNGDGEWLAEINLSDNKPIKDQIYEFKWMSSETSKSDQVCYQFADGPYWDDNIFHLSKPISSMCGYILKNNQYIKSNGESFTQYLGPLLYPTEQPEYLNWGAGSEVFDYNSVWFKSDYPEGTPFTLYARVQPKAEKYDQFARFSNPVILHSSTPPAPSDLPPLASPYPSMYEVEILRDTYIPPVFETAQYWGCVVVDNNPSNPAMNGTVICPPEIGKHDDCAGKIEALCLLEETGNAILFVLDHFVYSIGMIKWEMTEAISYAIPYCHDNGTCYKFVQETVEQVVYAGCGFPPHANSTEDLIAGWIGAQMISGASEYTAQIGVDEENLKSICGDDCQKKIGLQVIQAIRKKKNLESQNSCVNAYQAYFHNREAMCIDPSIDVHPAEGSGNFPAGITIKVTRKELQPGQIPPPETIKKYKVSIMVTGYNDTTAYGPGYSAPLYDQIVLPVYIFNPGESTVLNVKLMPPYYEWDGLNGMYSDGSTKIEATELCYSPDSSWEWVPCADGGYDSWQFDNPIAFPIGQP